MAIGTWNDLTSDWFDKTPFITACIKLHNFTINSHALAEQETFVNYGRDQIDGFFTVSDWTDRQLWGLTLNGDEPYNWMVYMFHLAVTEEGAAPFAALDCWMRIYCPEREEYYPNATGYQPISLPLWPMGFPFPGYYYQSIKISVDLTPPTGAWSAGSYEFVLQEKALSAPQRYSRLRSMVGVLTREP
jgi:hypothetical protein